MGYVTVSEETSGNPAYLIGYERQCWYESAWNDGIVRDMRFISVDSVFAVGECGLWLSTDRGRTWDQKIVSPDMSVVAVDSSGVMFIGWENSLRDSAGIAVWWPSIDVTVPVNNGLHNDIIHALVSYMASMIACTDSGAVRLDDYFDPMKLVCRRGFGDTIILSWDTVPAAMTYALFKGPNAYEILLTTPFETVIVPDTSLVITWIHGTQDTTGYFRGVGLNGIHTTSPSNIAGGFDYDLP